MKNITLFFLLISALISGQIQKVEPAFWWKGMKDPKLQVLLYGPGIATKTLELTPGVTVQEIIKTENPNYIFVTVNTAAIAQDSFDIILKDGRKTLSRYTYQLKERKSGSARRKSFSSEDVIYLIMPDRFANGNPANDSVKELTEKANRQLPDGRHGGDLRGIINHLDYLKNLGVTALWLTPVNEDNENKTSYHGYAQTDLYKIDGRYGSNEEYLELSQELQKRNMMLIQDYVTNHWGISHWLIQDLPAPDWIHQFPDGEGTHGFKRSNYRTTSQFDKNVATVDREEALNGWFDTTMPDLNQSNPLVLKYLTQNAIWWIEYAELGGLRVDTYPYNDKDAMAHWAKSITDEYPNLNIVGEAWMYSPAHIAYWQKDSKIGAIDGYNSQLPSVMDFTLFSDLPAALQEQESWDKGLIKIYNAMGSDFLYPNIHNIMVFFENHDTERWNEIFNADPRYYKMALTLIATIRGIPQIYYGSEIGMRGEKSKGDADIRRDFPGGWPGDAQNAFNPASQTAQQKEFHEFTRKLLNWRKHKTVIHKGKTTHYMPKESVYVYFRHHENEKVMVVINNNEQEQRLSLERFGESLAGVQTGTDIISAKNFSIGKEKSITIAPKSSLILELK